MAQQTINIGTIANDGTGDTLRAGMDKANDNFTELYAELRHAYTSTVDLVAGVTLTKVTTITTVPKILTMTESTGNLMAPGITVTVSWALVAGFYNLTIWSAIDMPGVIINILY